MRLQYADHLGPAREIHAGSGYWSQDSTIVVLGRTGTPQAIWTRWPGGQETTSPLPVGAQELTLTWQGDLKVLR